MEKEMINEHPEKTEERYQRFRDDGQKLGIPVFETWLGLKVIDHDGKVVEERKQRSHSFTRNYYNRIFRAGAAKNLSDATFGAGSLSMKSVGGTITSTADARGFHYTANLDERSDSSSYTKAGLLSTAGLTQKGIVVGTGVLAESFEHYAMATLITNGSGSGSLDYSQSELHSIAYNTTTKTLTDTLVRDMNNNSGATITVNEIGMKGLEFAVSSASYQHFMYIRDKLASGIAVPDSGQLRVTYTISLVYP